jgi:O-methyltransferase
MVNNLKRFVNCIYPSYSRTVDLVNRNALVGTWNSHHRDVKRFSDKAQMYRYLNEVVGDEPIDYLEFGVYQGESLRQWSTLNSKAKSRFFGFDSFEGLPEDWNVGHGARRFDMAGRVPEINDGRITFVKGLFQDSLPTFLSTFTPHNRLIIHIDCDLYSSTLFVLASCDQLMIDGTILMFDEFCSPLHEFRAFHDYTSAFRRSAKPVAICGKYAEQAAFLF